MTTTMTTPKMIIEIGYEHASAFLMDGGEITPSHDIYEHLADCCSSGDCEDACQYIIDEIGVEFRIVAKDANGKYENRLATDKELQQCCENIYFESETDFSDRDNAELYIVWQAASDIVENQCEENQ